MTLDFSNVSDRPTSRFLRLAMRVVPGVGTVESEIRPYADEWHERNVHALGSSDPLWVVLGDSLSLGVGASSIDQGWVMQTSRTMDAAGVRHRIVNLSISGARVMDVVERQLPAMTGLAATPTLVTVLIGSNDIIKNDLRARLPEHFGLLLEKLPRGALVGTVPAARGTQGRINAMVDGASRSGAVVRVPLHFASAGRAPDHFHPNDAGYSAIAECFSQVILARHAPLH